MNTNEVCESGVYGPAILSFSENLADLLETQTYVILRRWMKKKRVKDALRSNGISQSFFVKHFGTRILN